VLARVQGIEIGNPVNPKDDSFAINELISSTPRGVVKLASRVERVERAVELYYEQIRFLAENRSVDVIVCVMPNEMFDSITTSASDDASGERELEHNFRRILKARCMHLGTPLQLVREKTILITKVAGDQQDAATKAWNFCTALYLGLPQKTRRFTPGGFSSSDLSLKFQI
jgi:hypothetical protein